MGVNRGKQFEDVIKESFLKVSDVSVDRLHDQTTGFKGSQNICDFIVYKKPYEYYIECKSVHGNILPFSNITDTQWNGLLKKSKIKGVVAGIICWWIDKDVTLFIPIEELECFKCLRGYKSVRYDEFDTLVNHDAIELKGKKKRIFFEYDMQEFFNIIEKEKWI